MRTRRSPRNQERLFKELFKPPAAPPKAAAPPLDLKSAWWLSARAKKQIEQDRIRATQREAVKRALKGNPQAQIPRGKWINGKIRVTKSGKIEAMIPRAAIKRNPDDAAIAKLEKQLSDTLRSWRRAADKGYSKRDHSHSHMEIVDSRIRRLRDKADALALKLREVRRS